MSLYPYTITAIAKNTTASSNIVAGAAVSLLNSIGSPVTMYDNAEGSNGSTGKAADSRGQVTVYVEQGEYSLNVNGTASGKFTVISNLSTINVDTFANLELLTSTTTGQVFECQERANASYILKPSSYVALAGDATFANGRVAALQIGCFALGENFGVLPNGSDVSTLLNSFILRLKTGGLNGRLGAGDFIAKNIRLEDGAKPWSLFGAGKRLTKIRHQDGEGTLIIGPQSSVPYSIGGFTVDCRYSELNPSAANQAIAISNTNGIVCDDIHVTDYFNSAILINSSNEDNESAIISNSTCDGNAKAGNGFLIVSYKNALIFNSYSNNIKATESSGPAYGIQLKNKCHKGRIIACGAKDCISGIVLANDGSDAGPDGAIVEGCYSDTCTSGLAMGNSTNCNINIVIDQASAGENAIDLSGNSKNNKITATVKDVAALKSAVRIRSGSTNNSLAIGVDGLATNAKYLVCDTGSSGNNVQVDYYDPSDLPSTGYRSVSVFGDTTSNSFRINNVIPSMSFYALISGVVIVDNAAYELILIDTENAASTDDLTTITGTFTDGQKLSIRTISNVRDVTIKNSGNIITLTGNDVVMIDTLKFINFIYSSAASKFIQV